MALKSKSLISYGFTINTTNYALDFSTTGGELDATIPVGYYTLGTLATAVQNAMQTADPSNTYTVSVTRGSAPKITIATSGGTLSLLFSTGSRHATSVATVLGFNASNYTGSTSYQAPNTAGNTIATAWYGNNYLGPEYNKKRFGQVNISANGAKESVVYGLQQFINVEFKYESYSDVVSTTKWQGWIDWVTAQRQFEFTPEISSPNTFYNVTLEASSFDSKGLGMQFIEMIPDFPFLYTTGPLTMRVTV